MKIEDIEKIRKKYFFKNIGSYLLAFLIFLCGFVFFLLSFVFEEGRFFVLFFVLGIFISFFLPVFFFYQGEIQKQKFISYVYLEYLLEYSSCYDSFSFVYQTKDMMKHKGFLFTGKEKMILSPQYNYKGNISKTSFFSYIYEIGGQKNRLISFTLPYFVPVSFALISKEKEFQDDSYFLLKEEDDLEIYASKNIRLNTEKMISAIKEIENRYQCKLSLIFKDNICQVYFYDIKENVLSLKKVFSKKEQDNIQSDYRLVYEIYYALRLEES